MKLLVILAIIMGTAGVISAQRDGVTSLPMTKTGQTQIRLAPTFNANTIDGKPFSLSKYKGKVILINYWATWCPPCVAEIPDLIELQKKYPDKLQIVGISLDNNIADVRRFSKKYKFNYPIIMGDEDLQRLYTNVSAIPTTIVINKELMVVQVEAGYRKPEFFTEIVNRLSK